MPSSFYESEELLAQYLLLHYGAESEVLPYPFGPREALDFPARCVRECLDPERLPARARALDLGCAVGRSSFELAFHCEEVVGIDRSAAFIAAARALAAEGSLNYACRTEGELSVPRTARLPAGTPAGRVRFSVGDAQELSPALGRFDVVLLANLIDRLPRPAALIQTLPGLVNRGGQLIIASPYTWMEEFTSKDQWLGGFVRDDRPIHTLDTLRRLLKPDFELTAQKDLPFLIREHARKFQWSVSEATLWRRR